MTWNKTNFPVPNGSRNFRVIAAIIAQKKLLQLSAIAELVVPGHMPSPHDLRREEIRHFLQAEQHPTYGCTERDRDTSGGSGAQDLASFAFGLMIRSPFHKIRDIDKGRSRENGPSFVSYLMKKRLTMFPMQLAM